MTYHYYHYPYNDTLFNHEKCESTTKNDLSSLFENMKTNPVQADPIARLREIKAQIEKANRVIKGQQDYIISLSEEREKLKAEIQELLK